MSLRLGSESQSRRPGFERALRSSTPYSLYPGLAGGAIDGKVIGQNPCPSYSLR